ncbi:MAG: ATP-binding protein [Pseudoclavibacter sp.]
MRRREISDNPFRPGFGPTPPSLAGREGIIDAYGEAFVPGAWSSLRATIVTGHRGIGKTTMLGALEAEAKRAGWLVASVTARRGVVDELIKDRLPRLQTETDLRGDKTRISGLGFAGVTVQRTVASRSPTSPTLRGRIEDLLGLPGVRGLVISIDELNTRAVEELAEIVDVVQHGFREDLPIAFLGAGLFPDVYELKLHDGLTFLQRARTIELPSLTYDSTLSAIRDPIETAGRSIPDDALNLAATITQGYPYLTQVIGADAWDANPDELEITLEDVRAAFPNAHRLMNEQVLRPTMTHLRDALTEYLLAMADDDGPSLARDLETRLGVESNTLANRRARLLNEHRLIAAVGHGAVDFTLPYLREYLRDLAAERASRHLAGERPEFPPLPPLPGRGAIT